MSPDGRPEGEYRSAQRDGTPLGIEGAINLHLRWDGQRVTGVTVASSRPPSPARVLVGRSPEAATATLPLLFPVCARAQSAAALAAVDAARGLPASGEAMRQRARGVAAETVHEHAWRILLDWPQAVGAPADVALFSALRGGLLADSPTPWRIARNEVRAVLARHVLGEDPDAWAARHDLAALLAWVDAGRTRTARLLGQVRAEAAAWVPRRVGHLVSDDAPQIARTIAGELAASDRFARAPVLAGSPRETGAAARHAAHPLLRALDAAGEPALLGRLVARLIDVVQLTADDHPTVEMGTCALSGGDGRAAIAWVESARGLLFHHVRIAERVVHAYQIVAPTEWNFHPDGPLASEITGLAADDEATLRRRVGLLAQALDPCVRCEIVVDTEPTVRRPASATEQPARQAPGGLHEGR